MTARLALLSWMGPLLAGGQTLDLQDEIRTFTGLTNTAVTLTGRAELRLTGAGDPMPGCVIHLNSPDTLTVSYWPELPHGTYARWAASHPGHGSFTADLDGDGYDSLFEYALGLDPTLPNPFRNRIAFGGGKRTLPNGLGIQACKIIPTI